jgi:serine/threonine protein kinase
MSAKIHDTERMTPDHAGESPREEREKTEWIGRVIDDRYRIVEQLGEGGMGAVFVAEHLKLHKQVAFKVVRKELAGNGEVAARFAREAMATAQFEHPHVASAIDYGTLPEGGAYFVMQLVRGRSLTQILGEQKKLHWTRVCELGAQVADALSAAEAAGIVHRDLKPDNVLIETRDDGSELVRILDFGIARVPTTDGPAPEGAMATRELTRLGTIMGTPGYMAPEQAVGDPADRRADLYALGVVLWESIAGHALWDEQEVTALFTRQLSQPAPSIKRETGDRTVPDELDRLISRLLERKPADRPEHASEIRDTLRELSLRAVSARSRTDIPVVDITSRIAALRASAADWANRWQAQPAPRRRIQLAAVAVPVLLVALVIGLSGGDETPKQESKGETDASGSENMLSAVAETVAQAVAPAPGIPDEIKEDVETMLNGNRLFKRRQAAKKVLAYEPSKNVAPYVLNIAELETARGCRELKKAIETLEEAGDERTLDSLRRVARRPKTGCGFLSLQDCYRCVRPALARAIRSIENR